MQRKRRSISEWGEESHPRPKAAGGNQSETFGARGISRDEFFRSRESEQDRFDNYGTLGESHAPFRHARKISCWMRADSLV